MTKVYPKTPISSICSSNDRFTSSKQESFTIWMKSLVMGGKGCTVFGSDGQIVYRVDNYNCRSRDVYLMDLDGAVLFTILRKEKFKLFRSWEGYRSKSPKREGFEVRKILRISRTWNLAREIVAVGLDKNNQYFCYKIYSGTKKCFFKIVDKFGRPIAEVTRKQSSCGVLLGDDVLTMAVEPCIDHCLVMSLFVVFSLINSKM